MRACRGGSTGSAGLFSDLRSWSRLTSEPNLRSRTMSSRIPAQRTENAFQRSSARRRALLEFLLPAVSERRRVRDFQRAAQRSRERAGPQRARFHVDGHGVLRFSKEVPPHHPQARFHRPWVPKLYPFLSPRVQSIARDRRVGARPGQLYWLHPTRVEGRYRQGAALSAAERRRRCCGFPSRLQLLERARWSCARAVSASPFALLCDIIFARQPLPR